MTSSTDENTSITAYDYGSGCNTGASLIYTLSLKKGSVSIASLLPPDYYITAGQRYYLSIPIPGQSGVASYVCPANGIFDPKTKSCGAKVTSYSYIDNIFITYLSGVLHDSTELTNSIFYSVARDTTITCQITPM